MDLARKQVKNLCEPVAVRQISSLFLTGNIPQFSGKSHWHIVLRRREKGCPAGIFARPIPAAVPGCCERRQGRGDREKTA